MYQIIFSINNNEEVAVLPAVPPDFGPELPQNNETYGGLSKDYNLLGTMGLWSFELSSIFPRRQEVCFYASGGHPRMAGVMWSSSAETGSAGSPFG